MKKLTVAELKEFRDRLYLEIPDSALEAELPPYYHPGENSDEIQYMKERRAALGGYLPRRVVRAKPLQLPDDKVYEELRKGSGKQAVATTMAFVRLLKDLMREPGIGDRFVPIIPDEARTFGMDSLFPTAKIYDPHGQTYEAVDRNLLLSYKESVKGQILHEGISEAGAMGSMIAAGTSYATHGTHMIPVYIFYSMFGFQRTGDQMWALGDQLGRGFLLGATAGRTTLTGEGLQHNDGHSVLLASVSPACVAYDAAWAYELSYIVKDALRRMYGSSAEHPHGEDIFYYLTVYNEPYVQPAEPADYPGGRGGAGAGHPARPVPVRGHGARPRTPEDIRRRAAPGADPRLGRGPALGAGGPAAAGARTGASAPRPGRRRPGPSCAATRMACDEWNMLQPEDEPRVPYVTPALEGHPGPVVAVSDWIRVGARPDRPLGAGAVHLARHRRLGLLRHPAGRPPVLPRRRRVDHRRGAGPAGQAGRGQAGGARPGHRQVPAGPARQRRPPRPAARPPGRRAAAAGAAAAAAASLRPLRHRSFALLWGAGLVSNIGTWMQAVAVGALLISRTGQATWAVLVAAAAFLPDRPAVPGRRGAGRPGGAAAGAGRRQPGRRGGRRRAGRPDRLRARGPPVLVALVGVQGAASAVIGPFQQAILPDLVPKSEFLPAIALNSAQWNLGRIVGPAAAGATVAAFGYPVAFDANAVSFLAVVVALAFRPAGPARRARREAAGLGPGGLRASPAGSRPAGPPSAPSGSSP